MRYPSVIDGAIAASAPVAAFVSRFIDPPFDPAAYWQVRNSGLWYTTYLHSQHKPCRHVCLPRSAM